MGSTSTFNIAERVQTYTHPLWMLMLTGAYLVVGNVYYAAIGLSVSVSLFVFWLTLRQAATSAQVWLVTAVLLSSRASPRRRLGAREQKKGSEIYRDMPGYSGMGPRRRPVLRHARRRSAPGPAAYGRRPRGRWSETATRRGQSQILSRNFPEFSGMTETCDSRSARRCRPPSAAAVTSASGAVDVVIGPPRKSLGPTGSGIHPSRWTPDRSLVRT